MKEETYEKALDKHCEKLVAYGERLHDLVEEMLGDHCSVADVVGVLETEKMCRFGAAERQVKALAELLREDDGR